MEMKTPIRSCALITVIALTSAMAFGLVNTGPMNVYACGGPLIGAPVPPPVPPPIPPPEPPMVSPPAPPVVPSHSDDHSSNMSGGQSSANISSEQSYNLYVDLVITSIKCDYQTVTVLIKNIGTTEASGFYVTLYINPEEGNEGALNGSYVQYIASNESLVCVFTHSQFGYLIYYAVVDSGDRIVESNELNNVYGPVVDEVTPADDQDINDDSTPPVISPPSPPPVTPPTPPESPSSVIDDSTGIQHVNPGWIPIPPPPSFPIIGN
jgi:hypothetical protein